MPVVLRVLFPCLLFPAVPSRTSRVPRRPLVVGAACQQVKQLTASVTKLPTPCHTERRAIRLKMAPVPGHATDTVNQGIEGRRVSASRRVTQGAGDVKRCSWGRMQGD